MQRIARDLIDSYDEELELEIDDRRLDDGRLDGRPRRRRRTDGRRQATSSELFRLQGELVKLQDWVQHTEAQGRDPVRGPRRGRQGRRHQAHHAAAEPARVPRGRAAGAQRPRAHAVVLPALRRAPAGGRRDRAVRPQLVQPRRRRARDGLLHRRGVRGVLPHRCPSSRRMLVRSGITADQVLVLDHRRGAAPALPRPHPRPAQAVEAQPDGPRSRAAAGRTTPRPRRSCWSAPTSPRRPGGWCRRSTRRGRASTASTTCSGRCRTRRSSTRRSSCRRASAHADYLRQPVPAGDDRARAATDARAMRAAETAKVRRADARLKIARHGPPLFLLCRSALTRAYQRSMKALTKATLRSSRRVVGEGRARGGAATQAAARAGRLADRHGRRPGRRAPLSPVSSARPRAAASACR